MSQSTKLFIVIGFMFILFTTLNGHLEKYLRVVFGSSHSGLFGISGSDVSNVADFANTIAQISASLGPV